jgi:hypothetical protein
MRGFGREFDGRGDEIYDGAVAEDGDRQLPPDRVGDRQVLEGLRARDGPAARREQEVALVETGAGGRSVGGTTSVMRRPVGCALGHGGLERRGCAADAPQVMAL